MCVGEVIRGEDFTMSMKENLIGKNFRPQVLRGVGLKVVLRGGWKEIAHWNVERKEEVLG